MTGGVGVGLLIAALGLLAAGLPPLRPEQPVTDPVLESRQRLARRVQAERDREEDRRDRADDDVNENQGDDE